jgi:hypothetical protein
MRSIAAHILAALGEAWYRAFLHMPPMYWVDVGAHGVYSRAMLWSCDIQGDGPGPWVRASTPERA